MQAIRAKGETGTKASLAVNLDATPLIDPFDNITAACAGGL